MSTPRSPLRTKVREVRVISMVLVYLFEEELCTEVEIFSAGRGAEAHIALGEPGRLGPAALVGEEGPRGSLGIKPTAEGHELDDPLPVRGRDASVHHLLSRLGGDGAEVIQVEDVE